MSKLLWSRWIKKDIQCIKCKWQKLLQWNLNLRKISTCKFTLEMKGSKTEVFIYFIEKFVVAQKKVWILCVPNTYTLGSNHFWSQTYCEKKLFQWSRKTFEIRGWRPKICKNFEITRTFCSSSERSEQFLVTELFFNLFLEVSHT